MELSSSPMTERQRNYRATYRHRIAGWYNGWLHALVIYVIGFTALSVYFANISDLRWWELAIVPVTFLFANFFEWWIHRFVMHRPSQIKAFKPDVSAVFADLALFWTKFANMDAYCDRLDHLIARLGVKTIAPTHGLPITDVKSTVPKVQEGLKAAALVPESGTNEKVAAVAVAS